MAGPLGALGAADVAGSANLTDLVLLLAVPMVAEAVVGDWLMQRKER